MILILPTFQPMRENETRILIAGAGPAGISASLHLSKMGIHHTIIDKAVFPRDKICGDALSGKVVQELKRINPMFIQELNTEKNDFLGSYGVRFTSPGGYAVDIPFRENMNSLNHAPGFLSPRLRFDQFLVNKLKSDYCTFLEGTELLSVRQKMNVIEVKAKGNEDIFIMNVRLLISAEGERTHAGRESGLYKIDDRQFCAGIRTYFKGVSGMHEQNFIELHFIPEFVPGYLWIFPLPDGMANVGVGMLSSVVKRKRVSLRDRLLEIIQRHPRFKGRFSNAEMIGSAKGWGLPLGSQKKKLSGNNILMVGDAASLIDPFTGEGIGNAMVSGRIAAQITAKAQKENNFTGDFLSEYDSVVYGELWAELRLSRTLQKLSANSWLFDLVVKKAASNSEIRKLITGMFEDVGERSRLGKPRFYFDLLFKRT